jgi:hypothetical protein
MGNKFSLRKNEKLDVQKAIEQINKNDDKHDDEYDDDEEERERMIASRYAEKDIEAEIASREHENENDFNEIHVAFFRIDLKKYLDFISIYIDKPDSYYQNLNLNELIKNNFFTFIDSKFDEPLKTDIKTKLIKIFKKLFDSDEYKLSINKWRILIGKTIEYVFKQDDKFISTYIITFTNDSYNTYKDGLDSISCAQGIIERFVSIISSVLEILCITNADCTDEKSFELYKILNNTIDINEITQKWAVEHLDTDTIQNMSKEDRKRHFIEFTKNQYEIKNKQEPSQYQIDNILKYANDLDDAGIFERGYFGGKKYRRKIKKNKTNKKRNNRKRKTRKT